MSHRLPLVTLVFALIVALAPVALAESTVCASLNADLSALGTRTPAPDAYGDAIIRQKSELDRANSEYQRVCGYKLFGGASPNCPAITQRIQAMQANLAKLERHGGATSRSDPRQRLMAQLQQNRCGEPASRITSTAPAGTLFAGSPTSTSTQGRTFTLDTPSGPMVYREDSGGRVTLMGSARSLGQPPDPYAKARPPTIPGPGSSAQDLFGRDPYGRDPYGRDPNGRDPGRAATDRASPDGASISTDAPEQGGSFRTLCVRTCDGYYFPISYAASRSQFSRDGDICHARCPASETRLFYHRNPGEDSETAVAADNPSEAYASLPNALRYRREVVTGCTCGQPDATLMPVTGSSDDDREKAIAAAKAAESDATLPIPVPKPRIGEDPETLANMEQGFEPRVVEPPRVEARSDPDAAPKPSGPKQIRVVGPKFFADR